MFDNYHPATQLTHHLTISPFHNSIHSLSHIPAYPQSTPHHV
ncbi:MAG: hypothetical protein AAF208_11170 [Cyanobacteria bacterium P01_A01_bin.45]